MDNMQRRRRDRTLDERFKTPARTPLDMQTASEDLGRLLRQRRKELRYTQEYIAAFVGYSPRLIGDMERGKPTIAFQRYVLYASSIGIDLFAQVRGKS